MEAVPEMRKINPTISREPNEKPLARNVRSRRAVQKRARAASIPLKPQNESASGQLKAVLAASRRKREREMRQIIARVSGWAGGNQPAIDWYRSEPIPAFGGRTAESLVKSGQAEALRDYLDSIAVGGFA